MSFGIKYLGSLQKIDCPPRNLEDYRLIVPEIIEEINELAKPLQGLKIAHINATSLGGGVAEMLRSLVPFQRSIGFDSSWYVIPPNDLFFEVTKKIHNFLQGQEGYLTEDQKAIYLKYNNYLASLLVKLKVDIFIIHDPQPASALSFLNGKKPKTSIWRCHIDTSHPNKQVWDFLMPYLRTHDHFIFTLPEYAHSDFSADQLSIISPVIDPLSEKNIPIDKIEAKKELELYGIDFHRPLITQISRFDPWKDPQGVIDAYRLAKKIFPDLQLAMVAQMATDDPEGGLIYRQVKDYAQGDSDTHLLINLPDNDRAVRAFQVGSDIILQKSIREGFGLTVTEAMYKGAVVIGGNVGGIKIQIQNGVNGFLVNSSAQAAEKIIYLLKHPEEKEKISKAAHLSVRQKFLTPHNILQHLKLFYRLLNIKRPQRIIHYPAFHPFQFLENLLESR